jgi:hypothetical protein
MIHDVQKRQLVEALREMKELFRFALLSTRPEIAREGMVFVHKAEALIASVEAGASRIEAEMRADHVAENGF